MTFSSRRRPPRHRAAVAAVLFGLTPFAAAHAAEPARLATLTGAWKGGPAKEGGADYCVQEARFSSGHLLMIGRTKAGEVNIALGIPGGGLPVGERWKVNVVVDGANPRERVATAAAKGLLVVGMGFDNEFYDRLKKGKTLNLKSSADDIGFQLSGTAKALGELEKCAAGLPASSGQAASGVPGAGATPFPETLSAILGAAGLREVQTLVFPDTPPEKRPADYAWRVGKVLGGVRERNVAPGTDFAETTENYAKALKERCKGAGAVTLGEIERLPGVAVRSGAVDCEGEGGKGAVHVSLVSYLSDVGLFAVFFHEATPANKAEADDVRDRLAEVFRKVARQEPITDAPKPPRPPKPAPPAPAPVAPAPVTPAPVTPAAAPPVASTPAPAAPVAPVAPAVVEAPVAPPPAASETPAPVAPPVASPAAAIPLPAVKPPKPSVPAAAPVAKQQTTKQQATKPAPAPAKQPAPVKPASPAPAKQAPKPATPAPSAPAPTSPAPTTP
jgi:hypothetical protein